MARPREPWRRQALLDAAVTTAERDGLSGLTVKEVARAAGVSPATVHYHFADMEGVLVGVIERAFEQVYDRRLEAIATVPDIAAKLDLLIDLGVPDEVSHELALMYEAIPIMRARAELTAAARSFTERQVSLYRSVIDAGVATGIFTPTARVDVIARNLLALEDAYVLYAVVGAATNLAAARANIRTFAHSALGIAER